MATIVTPVRRGRVRLSAALPPALALSLTLVSSGCGVPADPDGTLSRVSGGELRVGVTERPPWVELPEGAEPQGIEPELVRQFAEQLDAEVSWVEGSEQKLVGDLEHGVVDLVIGGIPADTPWSEHAGITRPYASATDEHGQPHEPVMLVPIGENAFLLELDRFLLSQEAPS
jgi:ABC-type amino acid transport substrate-binding protein